MVAWFILGLIAGLALASYWWNREAIKKLWDNRGRIEAASDAVDHAKALIADFKAIKAG